MEPEALRDIVVEALEDLKGQDILVLDVRGQSSITDIMVIATGRSDRQVKALAQNVLAQAKQRGAVPIGIEGEREGEWVLVDLGDVVVHVMLREVRDFYHLEKLWSVPRSESG